MALSHAILVTLLDKPHSGYEIGKRFDQTVGFFWRARHQQIYSELHKLAAEGLVDSRTVEQADRPNRIEYSITEAGRSAVADWMQTPSPVPSVKEEMLVKLFALGHVPLSAGLAQVQARLQEHQERLALYQELMQQHYPEPSSLSPRKRGRYLGLRAGIMNEETGIRWCQEALELLQEP